MHTLILCERIHTHTDLQILVCMTARMKHISLPLPCEIKQKLVAMSCSKSVFLREAVNIWLN